MNLRQIECFVTIVDVGSVTGAAQRLGTSQPTLSAVLRQLESDLGAKLLIRNARGLALTGEGTAFLTHARAILAQIDASRRDILRLQQTADGDVSLGAPPMFAAHLLPSAVRSFLRTHPKVRIRVLQAGADQIREMVLRGILDLGIVADRDPPPGLHSTLLQDHPMVACVKASVEGEPSPPSLMMTWSELLDRPLILFPKSYHQRQRLEQEAARLGRRPLIKAEAESVPLMLDLVRDGHGVATLLAAAAYGAEGIIPLLIAGGASVPIALCRRVEAPSSPPVEALRHHLVAHLSAGPRMADDHTP